MAWGVRGSVLAPLSGEFGSSTEAELGQVGADGKVTPQPSVSIRWENITAAHYALIASALDAHKGEEKRFLIMFGSWHKYWFIDHLRERDDIVLRSPKEFVP